MSKPVYIVSEWLAKPGLEDQLRNCFKELIGNTINEPGCNSARITHQIQHPNSPGTSKFNIILFQEYKDIEAFDAHCASDYVKDFFKNNIEELVEDWRCRLFTEDE